MAPLCFILMPFGVKKDQKGRMVDFNKIYHDFIKEDFEEAGQFMTDAISYIPDKEYWKLKSTINNFKLLLDSFATGTDSHKQLKKLIVDLAKVLPNND